jgi:hypothetical protein
MEDGENRHYVDGRTKLGGNLDAGEPHPGRMRQASIILPQGMDGDQVILRAEIEVKGVRRSVRWACHNRTNPDGSLIIRLKKGSDPDWKKGVGGRRDGETGWIRVAAFTTTRSSGQARPSDLVALSVCEA